MLKINIHKTIPGFNLNASFEMGKELMAIMGPSGCGKSMALRCIAGLLEPDWGEIVLNGQLLYQRERNGRQRVNIPAQERKVGFVFQNYALFPHLSVAENIAFGITHLPRHEQQELVNQFLTKMRLTGIGNKKPVHLSGGQQQRVALARALIIQPQLLLLDEPFSAVDGPVRTKLEQELLLLLEDLKVPTLMVTHNIEEAYRLSEKMAVFVDGEVLQYGDREEVLYYPSCRTVARFTGMKNIFDGVVTEVAGETSLIAANNNIEAEILNRCNLKVGDKISFCIRPKDISFVDIDKKDRKTDPNEIPVYLSQIIANPDSYTIFAKAYEMPENMKDYHFQIEVSRHIFRKLAIGYGKCHYICLNKDAISIFR